MLIISNGPAKWVLRTLVGLLKLRLRHCAGVRGGDLVSLCEREKVGKSVV